MLTLDQAANGQSYTIKNFSPNFDNHMRLMELGFRSGETLSVMQRGPFNGPLKVCINNCRFAICKKDAACIRIEPANRANLAQSA